MIKRFAVICMFAPLAIMAEQPQALRERTQDALSQPPLRLPVPPADVTDELHERTRKALGQTPIRNGIPQVTATRPDGVDIAEIVREAASSQSARENSTGPVVFVSLSVPMASLQKLAADARRVGGVLVMRGTVKRSLKETVAAVQQLAEQGVEIQIDPQAFSRYQVEVVPAVVVDLSGQGGCDGAQACADRSVLVEGDVSLRYALDHIARTSKQGGRLQRQVAMWRNALEDGK